MKYLKYFLLHIVKPIYYFKILTRSSLFMVNKLTNAFFYLRKYTWTTVSNILPIQSMQVKKYLICLTKIFIGIIYNVLLSPQNYTFGVRKLSFPKLKHPKIMTLRCIVWVGVCQRVGGGGGMRLDCTIVRYRHKRARRSGQRSVTSQVSTPTPAIAPPPPTTQEGTVTLYVVNIYPDIDP